MRDTAAENTIRRALAAMIVGAMMLVGATAFAATPTEFVKQESEKATSVLAKPETPERSEELSQILTEIVDFRELASRALEGYWEDRSADEQQQFLDLLKELLRANYQSKLQGNEIGEDYEIEYTEEKQQNGRALVRTRVVWNDGAESEPVEYKLMKKDGEWTIYDLVIDDISLEESYRESYTQIIREDGWDTLIQRMQDKIDELKAEKQSNQTGN